MTRRPIQFATTEKAAGLSLAKKNVTPAEKQVTTWTWVETFNKDRRGAER